MLDKTTADYQQGYYDGISACREIVETYSANLDIRSCFVKILETIDELFIPIRRYNG